MTGESLIVNEELNTLVLLQETDSKIISLRQQLETIPSEIKKIEEQINKIEQDFENEKKKLNDLEKNRRNKEKDIEDLNEKIKKLKEKTPQIKTNKEYQALLVEIATIEENMKKEEEKLLIILYEIDEYKKKIEASKMRISSEKEKLESQKKQLEEEMKKIDKQIEEFKEMRKILASNLPSTLYEEYKELMKKHRGLAVTEVINSVCQGCFLHIPPQLYVEIKLNESIKYCPQCGRILYFKARENQQQKTIKTE